MLNRIGSTPAFQAYVNINRKNMTKDQLKVVNREDFQMITSMLREDRNPGVIRISADEDDKNALSMEIANFKSDTDLTVSVCKNKLHLDNAAQDMINLFFLYSAGYLKPDENGKLPTGGTISVSKEPLINFMM